MTSRGHSSIAFTGVSLVCSLGLDPASACAAMRAGLVRPTTIDTFVVGTLDDHGGATVHAAPVITHGFEGDARLSRLLHAAFDGFRVQASALKTTRIAFYLSLPHPDRQHTGFELIADERVREQEIRRWEAVVAERFQPDDPSHRAGSLLERAAALAGWEGPVRLRAISMNGNTGVAEMIRQAARDVTGGMVELAVVGGVDTLIDASTLLWLEQRGRLKSPSAPAGLAPGEAAGFVMIEDAHRAHGRGAEILGVLESNVIDLEQNDRLTGGIATGETLARVVADTAELADWSPDSRPWLIVDQNGEYYRAHEWGCALTRLVEHHSGFHQPVLWYPVMSVGDTGAACGIVQLSMALEAFRRGYAPAPRVLLLAAADSGHRSATLVAGGPLF